MPKPVKSRWFESILTDNYQTNIPGAIRHFLRLEKGDRIRFTIQSNGEVLLTRPNPPADDPALRRFLEFIARDIEENPQRVQFVDRDFADRINSLISTIDVDLDAELPYEDE